MTNSQYKAPNYIVSADDDDEYDNTEYKDNNSGCITGCVRILGALAIIMMMYMLVSKSNQKPNPQRAIHQEIRHNVDTCSKITDTFNIKTR
jgi:hypothetical protein